MNTDNTLMNTYIKELFAMHPNCGCCGILFTPDIIKKIDFVNDDVCCLDCFMLITSTVERLAKAIIYIETHEVVETLELEEE